MTLENRFRQIRQDQPWRFSPWFYLIWVWR